MKLEKAYKLLATQENISNKKAKELIDNGLVYVNGKKLTIARNELKPNTTFKVKQVQKVEVIFEDNNILAVEKPPFITSENISKQFNQKLLHRLDKETSGVLLLVKNEEFRTQAIKEFKNQNVYKEYTAWVSGKLIEEITINEPILTIKNNSQAYSKISPKGKEAITHITPFVIEGNKTKISINIQTGRTHQIRVHLKYINFPIIGDTKYGGKENDRILLHAKRIKLLDYDISSKKDI
jgi:RluA family pseudouridine synthase